MAHQGARPRGAVSVLQHSTILRLPAKPCVGTVQAAFRRSHRQNTRLRPRPQQENDIRSGEPLNELGLLCSFGQMAHRVGDYLKQDPLKLRFTSSNPQSGTQKAIIKRSLNQSVADITGTNYYSQHPNVIVYYELLDISIIELETKKSLKLFWTGRNNKEEVSDMPVIEFSLTLLRECTPSCYRRRTHTSRWRSDSFPMSNCNQAEAARSGSSTSLPRAGRKGNTQVRR